MTEEIVKRKPNWVRNIFFAAIVIVVVVVIMSLPSKRVIDDDCCQVICDKAGYGLVCISHDDNWVYCGLSYDRYGFPEAYEVFPFRIYNASKACIPRVVPNITEEVIIENVAGDVIKVSINESGGAL